MAIDDEDKHGPEDIEDALDEDEGEGVAEGDEDEDRDGDDEADEDVGGSEERRAEEPEVRVKPKRGASEVIRENKRRANEATRKADEALRRAEAAERRADEAERRVNERRQNESAEAEAARVELMSESERVSYYRTKDRQEYEGKLQGVQFQIWDGNDRAEFRQLTREDPLVAKVKDKVEAEYERLKAQGRPVSRELIANQEIAKMVRDNRQRAKTKQMRRADEGIRRETTRPTRARSEAPTDRQRRGREDTPEARRKRLEGVIL